MCSWAWGWCWCWCLGVFRRGEIFPLLQVCFGGNIPCWFGSSFGWWRIGCLLCGGGLLACWFFGRSGYRGFVGCGLWVVGFDSWGCLSFYYIFFFPVVDMFALVFLMVGCFWRKSPFSCYNAVAFLGSYLPCVGGSFRVAVRPEIVDFLGILGSYEDYLSFLIPFFNLLASLSPISSLYTSSAVSPFLFLSFLSDFTLTVTSFAPPLA